MFAKYTLSEINIAEGQEITLQEDLSRSFVIAMGGIMLRQLSGDLVYIRDIVGSGWSKDESILWMGCVCPGGNGWAIADTGGTIPTSSYGYVGDQIGVVIGTGDTPVTPGDHGLESQIRHGVSSGKVIHFSTLVSDLDFIPSRSSTVVGGSVEWKIERIYQNISGSDIVINELGLYVKALGSLSGSNYMPYCVIRDIVTPAVTFANGTYLKATYTVSIIT